MSHREAIEFRSPAALKEYLRKHPKADPKKHHVRKTEEPKPGKKEAPKGEPKGEPEKKAPSKDESVERALDGLSPGERTRAIERALEGLAAEREKRPKEVLKDLSKEGPGFEGLKDLSHKDQKALVEKALSEVEGENKRELEKILSKPRPPREARVLRIARRYCNPS